jgi:hypothetical protein
MCAKGGPKHGDAGTAADAIDPFYHWRSFYQRSNRFAGSRITRPPAERRAAAGQTAPPRARRHKAGRGIRASHPPISPPPFSHTRDAMLVVGGGWVVGGGGSLWRCWGGSSARGPCCPAERRSIRLTSAQFDRRSIWLALDLASVQFDQRSI